nr:hypothetical protein [Tanacetum cinerariifolium]
MSESVKRHEENSNLIKEIRASTDAAIRNKGASIKTLEIQIGFIVLDMPKDIKVPLILRRPFLSTAHAKIDVFKRKITLRFSQANGRDFGVIKSLEPLNGDYIELNDLNKPLELRRYQVDDLMPTIEEGEVIKEFRTRDDELDTGIDDYPSYCDYDKKIRIDYAYKLKFSCMIVLEDMDAYHDEGMGNVIFGRLFLREVGINAKRFEGMITIHNGNEEVIYQMVRSHPRILHSYQKLKSFYKGVLNLGPEYVRDAKIEEWLTRGGRSCGNNVETMEQYMSKTRADYGSGISRPKIENNDSFEIKGQFHKELRDNTFSGSDHEDANEHTEKVFEIVDLFHIPNITIDQVMLRAFPMSLTGAASRWLRNKQFGSITTWEDMKKKFLSKYFPPAHNAKKIDEIDNFQQETDENLYQAWERFKELSMKGAIPSKNIADAKVAIYEMAEYSQKWHNGTSRTRGTENFNGLAAIQAQLNNLGSEIKKVNEKVYAAQVGYKQCKGPHYTKDCPLKEERKTLEEAYYTQFGAPFQGGGYRETALGFYQRNNVNPSYQERTKYMEDTLSKFMSESAKRHEENSNLIKEIRASTDAAIRNQGASFKTLDIQIRQMSKAVDHPEASRGVAPSQPDTTRCGCGEAEEKARMAGECCGGAAASAKKSPEKFSGGGWPEEAAEFERGEEEEF